MRRMKTDEPSAARCLQHPIGSRGSVLFVAGKEVNFNAEDGHFYDNKLSAASYQGSDGVERLLLEIGANVNDRADSSIF